jgi:hypothetical protein
VTQRLAASGFNGGLPAGAFVSGLQVQVRKNAAVMMTVRDEAAQWRVGGVTNSSRPSPSWWMLAFNVEPYGGATERWGYTTQLTAEAVSAPDAAFVLSAVSNAFTSTAQLDAVQATVHWCPAR